MRKKRRKKNNKKWKIREWKWKKEDWCIVDDEIIVKVDMFSTQKKE